MDPQTAKALFEPKSIAVIGASRDPSSVGYGILASLVRGCAKPSTWSAPFPGKIYPVNPHARELLGLRCVPSILNVPGPVDLAIIAVPAKIVPAVVAECARKRVKAAIVVSAGFGELGEAGKRLEEQIVTQARTTGMRLVGPNCLGILRPWSKLNASFALSTPPAGDVAFLTQSGAMADSIIDWALRERYSFSAIVSLGNSADLDAADFLDWAAQDNKTKSIALYLEGVKDGRRFLDALRRATARKPVVVLKGGRTAAGTRAASTHTGALASDARVFAGIVRQGGAAAANSLESLFDVAKALAQQPRTANQGTAIVTNGGGAGVLCADACAEFGVALAEFPETLLRKLDATKKMHPAYSRRNPLDLVGDALPDRYEAALNAVLADKGVGGAIVIQTLQTMTDAEEDARVVILAHRQFPRKPVLAVFMGGKYSEDAINLLREHGVPDYNDPRKAARAMAALVGALR